MRISLLAATLLAVAVSLTACGGGRPKQELPEAEKANFEKLMQNPAAHQTVEQAAPEPIGADEDLSGPATLGGPKLDGNGNPVPEGKEVHIPAAH